VHPADTGGRHELYLMCDDIGATVEELRAKGVELARERARSFPATEPRGRA
jgi:hypothetical protein